jgi:hypothetical protein
VARIATGQSVPTGSFAVGGMEPLNEVNRCLPDATWVSKGQAKSKITEAQEDEVWRVTKSTFVWF